MSAETMLSFRKAAAVVMRRARRLGAERIPLGASLGRVLAQDVRSDLDLPPFNKAAMDGYACRRADLAEILTVIEIVAAGRRPALRIGPRQCAKIMTGAVVPEGADCVIRVEDTEPVTAQTIRFKGTATPTNICLRGEDIRRGAIVLRQGVRLSAPHVGLLAAVGCIRPLVARQPRVTVLATGDELVEPGRKPRPYQIRNSNGYQLCAQVTAAGALPYYGGVLPDRTEALAEAFRQAASRSDVVLISGGVSMGELDLVPGVLRKQGVRLLVERISVKPGMPTVFGVGGSTFHFGLPGNPVSTFVIFEILVKPFLLALMGHRFRPTTIPLRLRRTVVQRRADREAWLPVRQCWPGDVVPVEYHGPADLGALAEADGLIRVPRGVRTLREGTTVAMRPL